jgi:hypothetical protein
MRHQVCHIARSRLVAKFVAALLVAAVVLPETLPLGAQEATPVVAPEQARAGRLGGTMAEIRARFGEPDWTDAGLIGFNSVSLDDVDTILVVYDDGQGRARSFLLVYLERPEALEDPEAIAGVVADVAPADGVCEAEPADGAGLGDEVYLCQSDALTGVFAPADLPAFGVRGPDGSYNYAIDPTDDQFFEIAVRLGTAEARDPEETVEVATVPPSAPLDDEFPPVDDLDAVEPGDPLSFAGSVIWVAASPAGTAMHVQATIGDGDALVVDVLSEEDLTGVYAGTWLTVYGVMVGVACTEGGGCLPSVYAIKIVV